ncbi:MAG: sigma-70 family RNA polymerase sigma factor, partial [Thermodesulfobacteriota bacterium]
IIECIADRNGEDPVVHLNLKETRDLLAGSINELPDKERLVLSLYYYEDLNLKEIGKVLGVTESRVCQLHSQAVFKLKGKLRRLRI